MLNINSRQALKDAFISAYCKAVARRKNIGGWNLPRVWRKTLDKVTTFLQENRIDSRDKVREFVLAQFDFWTESESLRCFGLEYPPYGAMTNDKAIYRYELYLNKIRPPVRVESLKKQIALELAAITAYESVESVSLNILAGKLSIHTLMYMRLTKIIDEDFFNDVVSIVSDITNDMLVEIMDQVTQIIKENVNVTEFTPQEGFNPPSKN